MGRKTGPSAAQVSEVESRSGGLCEICAGEGQQFHHRKARHMGGSRDVSINDPQNLAHLCFACHAMVESFREKSYENGWLVHSWDDPAIVPFLKHGRRVRF